VSIDSDCKVGKWRIIEMMQANSFYLFLLTFVSVKAVNFYDVKKPCKEGEYDLTVHDVDNRTTMGFSEKTGVCCYWNAILLPL